MSRFQNPYLPIVHVAVSIMALLSVGFHVQFGHDEFHVQFGHDEIDIGEAPGTGVTTPLQPETKPGRAAPTLQPSPALIERLTEEEGFRGQPYRDSGGKLTIGIGTLLPLTRTEAQWLLRERLSGCLQQLASLRPEVESLPRAAKDVIADLCYSHGPSGVAQYHRMWVALDNRQWNQAASELLDSKFAREEAPRRAERLASQLRAIE